MHEVPIATRESARKVAGSAAHVTITQFCIYHYLITQRSVSYKTYARRYPAGTLCAIPCVKHSNRRRHLPELSPSLYVNYNTYRRTYPIATRQPRRHRHQGSYSLYRRGYRFKEQQRVPPQTLIIHTMGPRRGTIGGFRSGTISPIKSTSFPFWGQLTI